MHSRSMLRFKSCRLTPERMCTYATSVGSEDSLCAFIDGSAGVSPVSGPSDAGLVPLRSGGGGALLEAPCERPFAAPDGPAVEARALTDATRGGGGIEAGDRGR